MHYVFDFKNFFSKLFNYFSILNWKCSCYNNETAVLVSWPMSSLHILSHHCTTYFPCNLRDTALILHHNYILKAFVLKMVICTSYFFINKFSVIFKGIRLHLKIGLLLGLGVWS